MQQPSDERLVAFLDGEADEAEFAEISACLEHDAALRDRLAVLSEATALVRDAFESVLHEPVPAHLIEACRADSAAPASAEILPFRVNRMQTRLGQFANGSALARKTLGNRRWWMGLAAASVFGILIGASVGYFAAGGPNEDQNQQVASVSNGANWLDNIAIYHNLFIKSAVAGENKLFVDPLQAPVTPADITIPNLKPWNLQYLGAHQIVIDGKPAFQFFYISDNKQLGKVTLYVTNSDRANEPPTFERHDNVNMLYWRHQGHGYAIVSTQADKGWLWGLANDIEFQLKAI